MDRDSVIDGHVGQDRLSSRTRSRVRFAKCLLAILRNENHTVYTGRSLSSLASYYANDGQLLCRCMNSIMRNLLNLVTTERSLGRKHKLADPKM